MNERNTISAIFIFALTISAFGQTLHKGFPIVKITNPEVNLHVYINDIENNSWKILPRFSDSLYLVKTYSSYTSNITFKLVTEKDSIEFDIGENETKNFFMLLNKKYILKTVTRQHIVIPTLTYLKTESNPKNKIMYTSDDEEIYLDSLKQKYPINLSGKKTQVDSVMTILNWTHNQWKHNGNNSPKKNDAISILDEVKEGGRFPCFAYALVLASQLKAAGFKSRVIYLKTKNIATSMQGGGHVATEVFIDDLQKWIFTDGQFNAIPFLNNVPLNALELQNAIQSNIGELEFRSLGNVDKMPYIEFLQPYLFFFDCAFDQRESVVTDRYQVNEKQNLMLVPLGASNPTFMLVWNSKIDYCEYTNSISDFYAKPN